MNESRRSFLKIGGLKLATLPFAGSLLAGLTQGSEAYAADLPACKEDKGPAKALKYIENAHKPPKGSDRTKPEHKDQFCKDCRYYSKANGESDKERGKCVVIPGCTVAVGGWCRSYDQKKP